MAGHHDVGGQDLESDGGPIDRSEHQLAFWEQQVDALSTVLRRHGLLRTDELRRAIEALPADAYRHMSYYEKWSAAMAAILVEKGFVSRAELARRLAGRAAS